MAIVVMDRNETTPFVLAEAALNDGMSSLPDMVCVGDRIDTDMQEGFLRYICSYNSGICKVPLHLHSAGWTTDKAHCMQGPWDTGA